MMSETYQGYGGLVPHAKRLVHMVRLSLCLSAVCAALLTVLPVHAKDEIRVIAVVNGEPITNFELADRVLFLRAVSQLNLAEQELRRDALQGLIGDRLKTQFGKTVVPGIMPQLDGAARQILDQNFEREGTPGSAVLKQLNIPHRTVLNKIKADILWGNSLRQKFKRQFRNISKSAEQELNKLKQLKSEPQIRFSEIILLPNPNRSLEETEALAEQIIAALNKGADFASIAQQYSDAATSGRGGLVDWVFVSRLPNLVKDPLVAADKGEVVGPLVFGGQVFILRKRDMRELGQMDPLAATVSLARVVAPTPATASAAEREQAAELLLQQAQGLNSCPELAELGRSLAPDIPSEINDISIGSLSPQLQRVILDLDVGQTTAPLPFSEGMVIFMLCDKSMPGFQLPDIKVLEQAELEKLLSTISGRFLLRLQRQASITYKDESL